MKRRALFLAAVLIATGCGLVGSRASAATLNFVSDTSWDAYDADPLSGGSLLGQAQFVCLNVGCPSSCPPGATLYGYSCGYWGADLTAIPGAHWVWKPIAVTDPADLAVACLSKTFELVGLVVSATVYAAADDYAEVRINGQLVGSVGSVTDYGRAAGAQGALVAFNAAPYLVPGTNRFVVCAQDGPSSFTGLSCNPCDYSQNPAGVVFGGTIEVDQTTPTKRATWGGLKVIYR